MQQAIAVSSMMLEQIACDLAQSEKDDGARQRQQAVMAVAKRLPLGLRAARAEGRILLEAAPAEQADGWREKAKLGALGAGVLLLAGLAVHEAIGGETVFALIQALGAVLVVVGAHRGPKQEHMQPVAQGIAAVDAQQLVREVGEICQAADVCTSDLGLIEGENRTARLTGTADSATLDLLSAMMEAKASGREDLALRTLGQAEQTLRMLGVDAVSYAPEHAPWFDVLPTLSGARTVRPALVKEGKLLRRGVAAVEGGNRA